MQKFGETNKEYYGMVCFFFSVVINCNKLVKAFPLETIGVNFCSSRKG